MKNNNDPAIRVRRNSSYDETNDDFPTPPWAVRAFFEYVAPTLALNPKLTTMLEPACGRGHMVGVLRYELEFKVHAYDSVDYGKGFPIADYGQHSKYPAHDVMFTNPPYKFANAFALRGLREARRGVALLMRTIWMEGVGRHDNLFKPTPPTAVFVFSRRMNAAHGKLARGGGAAMSHSWFWWDKLGNEGTQLGWIPPDAQKLLERESDYEV